MITGGCLCGGVRYRYDGDVEELAICHCSQCRKAQGTAMATNIRARADAFTLEEGDALLSVYYSSPNKMRVFCSNCGSPIYSQRTNKPEWVRLRAGTVDGDFEPHYSYHIHYGSRVSWFDPDDDLDRYETTKPQ